MATIKMVQGDRDISENSASTIPILGLNGLDDSIRAGESAAI
jgi:hypothetical protein